uniref:hypothetical protein n=1 Tax=Myroides sp. DW712 TaxID=3389800 RepID=UPI00397B106A
NIINELNDTYGNVGFDTTTNQFFYYDADGNPVILDGMGFADTKISSFEVDEAANALVITDTNNTRFTVGIDELGTIIAKNDVFVTQLVENQEFITQLGDNIDFINQITTNEEFITNIINELNDTYGNVGFDTTTNQFFYYDADGNPVILDGMGFADTKISSFEVDEAANALVITDTNNTRFTVGIDELGTIIAKNDVFVTQLVENQEFITQLGENIDFINQITTNEEFITNIINELNDVYGNVVYENNNFYAIKEVNGVIQKEIIDLTVVIQNSGSSLVTDGVIGVTVDGTLGIEAQKAVLQSLTLSLNNDKVTTTHIKDGTILPIDMADGEANQVLVTGANKKAMWKDQAKVAPNFFYMPAVIFDTSSSGTAMRDLYQDYVNQFTGGTATSAAAVSYPISHGPAGTTPLLYHGGIVGSTGAPEDIAVFSRDELYYYITYYDENVFENLSITSEGKLSYTVKTSAESSAYMNIVFVIK